MLSNSGLAMPDDRVARVRYGLSAGKGSDSYDATLSYRTHNGISDESQY